jgi:hypothetical protein
MLVQVISGYGMLCQVNTGYIRLCILIQIRSGLVSLYQVKTEQD